MRLLLQAWSRLDVPPQLSPPLPQTYVVISRLVLHHRLDAIGQEAEDGPNPQQDGEAAKELPAELDPFWCGWRRRQGIGTILG